MNSPIPAQRHRVTGTVSTTTPGTYTLHYNVKDSKGLAAEEKRRTVSVTSGGGDGGGGGSGCSGACGGGGGGGGAVLLPPSLRIYNETIEKTPISGIVLVRWQTNIPSDSRVAYGTTSITSLNTAAANYGYPFGTPTVSELTTTHVVAVAGLNPQRTYYFRPISKTGNMSANGVELTLAPSECYYLREFIKFGANNNPEEVKKLQIFLNSFEGANLDATGFYDVATLHAVNSFQVKYKVDILDPWGHEAPTGFVYLTTRKQVNEIYCRAAFPLNTIQQKEVDAFKALLESLKRHGIVPSTIPSVAGEVLGVSRTGDAAADLGEEEGTTTVTETRTTSKEVLPVTKRSALGNMLSAAYGAISDFVISYWLIVLFAFLAILLSVLMGKFYRED
ncbi:MAG: DUF5011 domain-containing protein [Parcubacteria group bacterium]|nr:DUF5011 domain-containing protein [Parcubacteria group bacterium]